MIAELALSLCLMAAQPATPLPEILPAERILWTHPTWWDWWHEPNFRNAIVRGDPLPITGVIVMYVEGRDGDGPHHAKRIRKEAIGLGLEYVHGIRHSHQSREDLHSPMTREFQERAVYKINMIRGESFALDCEPYYNDRGLRYHGVNQWPALALAARPWSEHLLAERLYVYPAHPSFSHPMAIMGHATRKGVDVYALDHTTYRGRDVETWQGQMAIRSSLWQSLGYTYVPGFYLYWLSDPEIMRQAAAYRTVWFFPRAAKDQLNLFGTRPWRPAK